MCRLMLFNRKAFEQVGDELFFLMAHLEASMGGHGNGVATLRDGHVSVKKGVDFSIGDAYEVVELGKWDWFIFHTRLASVGKVSDKNCHPFRLGSTVLAMNGTERGFAPIAESLGITDTEAVLRVYKKLELPIPYALARLNSAFVGFHKGKPFAVCAGYSDMEVWEDKDTGAVIIASEFMDYWEGVYGKPSYAQEYFVWYDGEHNGLLSDNPVSVAWYKYVNGYKGKYKTKSEREVKNNGSTGKMPVMFLE